MADRQRAVDGEQGKRDKVITEQDIQLSVQYLVNMQNKNDGSFSDPKPVIHREMQVGCSFNAMWIAVFSDCMF